MQPSQERYYFHSKKKLKVRDDKKQIVLSLFFLVLWECVVMCSNMNASESQYHSQGFDDEDEFGEFGIESSENQENNVVKPDSPVNYQTYMNKTSRTRWSKQDTELFYEVNLTAPDS